MSDVGDLRGFLKSGSRYFINPCAIKMYHYLQNIYWWNGLKKDIAVSLAKCQNLSTSQDRTSNTGWLTHDIAIPT